MLSVSDRRRIAQARVGREIAGRFRIVRLLGLGGMAAVYEAQHRNGKRLALKVLHARADDCAQLTKRLLREAYVANSLDHPAVVQVFDDGLDSDGSAYLVMELLEGQTAAQMAKQHGGKLALARVYDIADTLLDVLEAAHARGVVHRDIKPDNLFICASGELKVLDFGIARVFDAIPGATIDTHFGSLLGTPAFMAQEQARGRWDEVDARTDLWAVGATLFNLASGRFVHAGETANEQLGQAMTMSCRSLASVAPELPDGFVAVIDHALRYERAERWPSARAMRSALAAARAGEPQPAAVDLGGPREDPARPDTRDAVTCSAASQLSLDRGARSTDHRSGWRRSGLIWVAALALLMWVLAAESSRWSNRAPTPMPVLASSSTSPQVAPVGQAPRDAAAARAQGRGASGSESAGPLSPPPEPESEPMRATPHRPHVRRRAEPKTLHIGEAAPDPLDLRY